MIILGIHGGLMQTQHDASATLLMDGELVAACEEERFVRVKSAHGYLPINAISQCLSIGDISIHDVDLVVHSGETHGDLQERIHSYLLAYFGYAPEIVLIHHHLAHLASAYFCSGYDSAVGISCDAYGDGVSTAIAACSDQGIELLETRKDPDSLGLFYASITSFLGFRVSEDE